jgi:hypothetical protein
MQLRLRLVELNFSTAALQSRFPCFSDTDLEGKNNNILNRKNQRLLLAENCELLKRKSQATLVENIQREKNRQETEIQRYEKARNFVCLEDLKKSILLKFQISESLLRIKSDVTQFFDEKTKSLQHGLQSESVKNPEHGLQSESVKNPEADFFLEKQLIKTVKERALCEAETVFSALLVRAKVYGRFLTEMVEGLNPSLSYAKETTFHGFLEESENLLTDLTYKLMHQKCALKLLDTNYQKIFEKNRLITLGTNSENLTKIDTEIENFLRSDFDMLLSEYVREKENLNSSLLTAYTEVNNNQIVYDSECDKIMSENKSKLSELVSNHKNICRTVQENEIISEEVKEEEVSAMEQA